ncbi:MAG: hypothetical protein LBG72_07885 [Spirochaetaceae bacterium]|jgi:hypothetical protein|nr:hypothetical protein [Spirochaetaceae bacterium]
MAIAPIDLQTLFTQMDKVGKEQTAIKDGTALHKAIHGEVQNRKIEERMEGVMEAEQTGEGLSGIQDDKEQRRQQNKKKNNNKNKESEEDAAAAQHSIFRDPAMGTHLDLSG